MKSRGPVAEILGWIRAPDIFYALRRHADYSPTGPKGEKTHISYALRVFAAPAYVADPDGKALQKTVVSFKAIAPPPKPVPPLRFSKGEVVDGVLVPFGAKAEPLREEMLLPPKPAGRTAD